MIPRLPIPRALPLLLAAGVLLGFPAEGQGGVGGADPSAAKEFLRFQIPGLDGGTLSSDDLVGKIVVVDVWGTWCGPCRQAVPHLVEIQKRFAARGVEVVGIAAEVTGDYDAAFRRVREFARELGINYRLGMITEEVYAEVKRLMRFEGDQFTVPTTLVLDREGAIIARYPGYFFGQEKEIAEILNQRLGRESRPGNGGARPIPQDP